VEQKVYGPANYYTHIGSEEFYYLLEGKGLMIIDGESVEMGPGNGVGVSSPRIIPIYPKLWRLSTGKDPGNRKLRIL
jgi:hypothetical protein